MKVLIACEFSGRVREQFKKLGHDAWSCDLLPSEIKGQHILDDVLNHLDDGWDLMIAHPPCTYLSAAGNKFNKLPERQKKIKEAKDFFFKLWNCKIPKICIENPVGSINRDLKPTQIIQPWQFGDKAQKRTCLWIKNLPKLIPSYVVEKGEFIYAKNGRRMPKWYSDARWDKKARSRTFPGIAKAMGEQWGK
jgi:hypothetical protein